MRIALLSYSTKQRGGVVHTLALAEALAADGADATVRSLGRGGDRAFFRRVDPFVTVRLMPFPERAGESVGARILRSIEVLADAFEPSEYDVVHAQDCISANAVGRTGASYLRTVHHLDTFSTPELAACHERAVVEPSTLVCVSGSVATELLDGWGIAATVIPNGVDGARFERAAAEDDEARSARQRWTASYAPYLLSLGGIEPRKGSLDLMEAYALARLTVADLRLVVAGGETLFDYRDYRDYRARWERRARELDVHPVLLGVVPDELLPSLVAAASLFAFPSTKEGFGLAPMEALAAGVPVVLRDLPVLSEIFESAATLARGVPDLAAGIINGLEAPDPRRTDTGHRLARRHTWESAAGAHRTLYATWTAASSRAG